MIRQTQQELIEGQVMSYIQSLHKSIDSAMTTSPVTYPTPYAKSNKLPMSKNTKNTLRQSFNDYIITFKKLSSKFTIVAVFLTAELKI